MNPGDTRVFVDARWLRDTLLTIPVKSDSQPEKGGMLAPGQKGSFVEEFEECCPQEMGGGMFNDE